MKDALGHGSNGDGTMLEQLRARLSHVTSLKGGGVPSGSAVVSDKSAAPVHPSFGVDRSSEIGFNRDFVFRARNKLKGL